jgi:hypothetical protein
MASKQKVNDGKVYFDPDDVKSMLMELESVGYTRAELFIHEGTCDICSGKGQIDRWNSYTGQKENPPYDKMCCWKCCGDGKLPAKCSRDKLGKYII